MSDPLFSLGARRTAETLREVLIPMGAVGYTWWAARSFLGTPTVSRELDGFELAVILGAIVVVVSWYAARQLTVLGSRRPWRLVGASWVMVSVVLLLLARSVKKDFDTACTDELLGMPTDTEMLHDRALHVCQLKAVPGNPYLPGTLLRPVWDGSLDIPMVLYLGLLSLLTTLGLRDQRLFRSRMGLNIAEMLQYAPSTGTAALFGDAPKEGKIQACGNSTLWGELCGQMYAAEKVFEEGEWCVRCAQVYRRCDRELTLSVVSLFTNEVDVLNGLERLDAVSWNQGDPMPPDPRLSGQERWVRLGTITVPDVLTVSTLLAVVHEQLSGWSGEAGADELQAFELAIERASRISAWIWFGKHSSTLTYARPTTDAMLISGPARLRDLMLERGEELVLQLDIGLLPLELRTGFRQTFLEASRQPQISNSKQDLWIPVAGGETIKGGLWVPRLEGAALRTWLSLDRMRPTEARGVTTPLPYLPVGGAVEAISVRPGSIDLVRMPIDSDRHEPIIMRRPGDSIAEWEWMDWRLLELLRQESLVMVDR